MIDWRKKSVLLICLFVTFRKKKMWKVSKRSMSVRQKPSNNSKVKAWQPKISTFQTGSVKEEELATMFQINRSTSWWVFQCNFSRCCLHAWTDRKITENSCLLIVLCFFFLIYFLIYLQTGEIGVKETPQQKFQRLQHEIRELAEEVNQIKDGVKVSYSFAFLDIEIVVGPNVASLETSLRESVTCVQFWSRLFTDSSCNNG